MKTSKLRKLMAVVLAGAMVMAMGMASGIMAFAAGTGSITITPPEGTESETTNTYKIYKVFDADGDGTNISYKLVSSKTTAPDGFSVDRAGNVTYSGDATADENGDIELTSDDIAAIAAYVTEGDLVKTVTSTGTAKAVASELPNGYYYITTSTGTVATVNSTNPNVTVIDKNAVPQVEKVIDGVGTGSFDETGKNAIAQVGTTVNYTATVKVVKGQHNYVFHDTMSTGLTYNKDVAVTGIGTDYYTVKDTPDTGDTLTITFEDGIDEGTEITIKYSATVNAEALDVDYANNTASVSYGDGNASSSVPVDPKVYTAGISVIKYDGKNTDSVDDDIALAGAGFKLMNSNNKYYKLDNGVVTWVDTEAAGDEHKSDSNGNVDEFVGLGSGTYTLVETTVPSGYNTAANVEVEIGDADNELAEDTVALNKSETVINNTGAVLPSTGGIGTTLFYTIGGLLVAGGLITVVVRRRLRKEEN